MQLPTISDILTAGDTLDFTTSVPDYPASAGWTLKYRLAPRSAGTAIDLTAAANGDDFDVTATSTTTASWATGWYTWTAFVEKAGERYTVGRGQLEIRAASSTLAAATDGRGHARKVLDAIEAVLENRATLDQESYAINGRSLKRMPIEELLKLRQVYRAEVLGEEAAERLDAGLGMARKVQVRL